MAVARLVQRAEHVGGEAPRFGENRVDQIGIEIAKRAVGHHPLEPGAMLERKGDIADGRAVAHRGFSGRPWVGRDYMI